MYKTQQFNRASDRPPEGARRKLLKTLAAVAATFAVAVVVNVVASLITGTRPVIQMDAVLFFFFIFLAFLPFFYSPNKLFSALAILASMAGSIVMISKLFYLGYLQAALAWLAVIGIGYYVLLSDKFNNSSIHQHGSYDTLHSHESYVDDDNNLYDVRDFLSSLPGGEYLTDPMAGYYDAFSKYDDD